jgi:hypothetical protein
VSGAFLAKLDQEVGPLPLVSAGGGSVVGVADGLVDGSPSLGSLPVPGSVTVPGSPAPGSVPGSLADGLGDGELADGVGAGLPTVGDVSGSGALAVGVGGTVGVDEAGGALTVAVWSLCWSTTFVPRISAGGAGVAGTVG